MKASILLKSVLLFFFFLSQAKAQLFFVDQQTSFPRHTIDINVSLFASQIVASQFALLFDNTQLEVVSISNPANLNNFVTQIHTNPSSIRFRFFDTFNPKDFNLESVLKITFRVKDTATLNLSALTLSGVVLIQSPNTVLTPIIEDGSVDIIPATNIKNLNSNILYNSLQLAVNQANANDELLILTNRNYPESVTIDKNLTLSSNAWNYSDISIDQLLINDGSNLIIEGNMSILEVVHLKGNTSHMSIDTGISFALRSTDTGTAMIINDSPTNTIVGNVIMERFLKPVNDLGGTNGLGYHLFSSPFSDAPISQFEDDMNLVLNFAFNTAPEPAYVRPFPNFFTYGETNQGLINGTLYTGRYFISNYRVPTGNPLDILEVGKGYQANIATTAISGNVVELNGTLNNGDYLIPLTNSGGAGLIALGQDGFNLIGNPYPSPLDWDKIIGNNGNTANAGNSNVADAIYMDVPITQYEGRFAEYVNGVANNGGQSKIASMQGFFVKCTAPTGTLELKNEDRLQAYEDVRFFKTQKKESAKEGLLQIALKKGDKLDETTIYFEAGATPNFDAKFDAVKLYKMSSQYSSIYSYNQNTVSNKEEYFAINGLGSFDEEKTLPLAMNILADGEYEITLRSMKYFHSKHQLYLYDSLTDSFHNLRTEGDYKFTAKKGTEIKRFVLLFKTNATKEFFEDEKVIVYPNPTSNEFSYSLKTGREGNYTIRLFDATGRVIFEDKKTKEGAFLEGKINLEKEVSGLYLLQIIDSKKTMTVRIVKE